jgi:hypothetical protein
MAGIPYRDGAGRLCRQERLPPDLGPQDNQVADAGHRLWRRRAGRQLSRGCISTETLTSEGGTGSWDRRGSVAATSTRSTSSGATPEASALHNNPNTLDGDDSVGQRRMDVGTQTVRPGGEPSGRCDWDVEGRPYADAGSADAAGAEGREVLRPAAKDSTYPGWKRRAPLGAADRHSPGTTRRRRRGSGRTTPTSTA